VATARLRLAAWVRLSCSCRCEFPSAWCLGLVVVVGRPTSSPSGTRPCGRKVSRPPHDQALGGFANCDLFGFAIRRYTLASYHDHEKLALSAVFITG